jgi:putative membrane protein
MFMNSKTCINTTVCILTALMPAIFSGSAFAQRDHSGSRTALSTLDKSYLKDTAQSNLEEVRLEPIVMSHATSRQYRQFGQRMKKDHSHANAELERLASRVDDKLPSDVSKEQKAIMHKLSHLHGAKFDAAYKEEMIRDHTGDIAKTEREISLGGNPQVKANAEKNLVMLKTHLRLSRALPSSGA